MIICSRDFFRAVRFVVRVRRFSSSIQVFSLQASARFLPDMLKKEDVASMRTDYDSETFCDKQLESKDPLLQFDAWFRQAANTAGIGEANAMTLATCNA